MDPVWDSGGQRAESRRVHCWIQLIAHTCASIFDCAGNDKEQHWKHMGEFIHLSALMEKCNNVDWSRSVFLSWITLSNWVQKPMFFSLWFWKLAFNSQPQPPFSCLFEELKRPSVTPLSATTKKALTFDYYKTKCFQFWS